MKFFTLFPRYFAWHYTRGLWNYLQLWGNFIWFFFNYFSFKILLKTLFSPFKRLTEKNSKGFDPGQFFSDLIINILMRIVGFLMRITVIISGALTVTGVFFIGLVLFFVWLAIPPVLLFFIIAGLIAIFKDL